MIFEPHAGRKPSPRERTDAPRMRPRDLWQLLKTAACDWVDDGAMRLSSSLAYYAIFSLAPLLVIVISMAGLFFGEEAARGHLRSKSPPWQARACWRRSSTGLLFFGASTVFAELKDALNAHAAPEASLSGLDPYCEITAPPFSTVDRSSPLVAASPFGMREKKVARPGFEPGTRGFSISMSFLETP